MLKEAKISVIIPVYNTSTFLEKCLDSVCSQTLNDIEVIIVNDASTDNSQDIINKYCSRNPEFINIIHSQNEGLPSARNSGVEVATGTYIIHLDSDDYWTTPEALRLLYDIAETDNCEILRFNGIKAGKSSGEIIFEERNLINVNFRESSYLWHFKCVFLFLFRRDFLIANAASFNPAISIGEDAIFLSSILPKSEKISTLSKTLYAYRVNDESMMRLTWPFDKFIEEQHSSFATSDNLRNCQAAWISFWQYRLNQYLPLRILKRSVEYLETQQVQDLIKALQNYFSPEDKELLLAHPNTSAIGRKLIGETDAGNIEKTIKLIKSFKHQKLDIYQRITTFIKNNKILFQLARNILFALNHIKETLISLIYLAFHRSDTSPFLISNLEKKAQFNVEINNSDKIKGVSAMLRVKNEEGVIFDCLRSIEAIFDEIVIIDNDSSDDTLGEIAKFMDQSIHGYKVKIHSYPHQVSKCGKEHQQTPFNSIHSLSYYYNWCLSLCTHKAVFKWDADMILSDNIVSIKNMKTFLGYFSKGQNRCGVIPIQTVYLDQEGKQYLSISEVNEEVRIFKNTPMNHFEKGEDWEVLSIGQGIKKKLGGVYVYEIKDVRKDEFSNWSNHRFTTERKVAEFRNYHLIHKRRYSENRLMFKPIDNKIVSIIFE